MKFTGCAIWLTDTVETDVMEEGRKSLIYGLCRVYVVVCKVQPIGSIKTFSVYMSTETGVDEHGCSAQSVVQARNYIM